MMLDTRSARERWYNKIFLAEKENAKGCWIDPDRCHPDRYPCLSYQGKGMSIPRFYLIHIRGIDMDGLEVRHECEDRACYNPAHFKPGTQSENNLDRYHPGHWSGSPSIQDYVEMQAA